MIESRLPLDQTLARCGGCGSVYQLGAEGYSALLGPRGPFPIEFPCRLCRREMRAETADALVKPTFEAECVRCRRAVPAHEALVQVSCPECLLVFDPLDCRRP